MEELFYGIGMCEFINAVLVQNGIRNGMLIQYIDYKEYSASNNITKNKLNLLKIRFPELYQTECNQGIILSKTCYKNEVESIDKSSQKLGEILGYPSAIEHLDDTLSITLELVVKLKIKQTIQLFANRCNTDTVEHANIIMQDMASKSEAVILNNPWLSQIVDKVEVIRKEIVSVKCLINKILNFPKTELSQLDISEILNYIWNLDFDILSKYPFDYTNPVHKGIVLTLLSYFDNNPMEPFYPLQYHTEYDLVVKKENEWETELLRILDQV